MLCRHDNESHAHLPRPDTLGAPMTAMRTVLSYLLLLVAAFAGCLTLLMLAASIRWFIIDWRQPGIADNLQWALLWGATIAGFVTYFAVWLGRWTKGAN